LLTHRQTNKQTKTGKNITSLAEVMTMNDDDDGCNRCLGQMWSVLA